MSFWSFACLLAHRQAPRHPRLAVPLGRAVAAHAAHTAHACLVGLLVALIAAITPHPGMALPETNPGDEHFFSIFSLMRKMSGSTSDIRWGDWDQPSPGSVQAADHLYPQEQISFNPAGLFPGSRPNGATSKNCKEVLQCELDVATSMPFVRANAASSHCCKASEETVAGADSSPPTLTTSLALDQRQQVRRQQCQHLLTKKLCGLSNPSLRAPQLSRLKGRGALSEATLLQPILQALNLQRFEWSKWDSRRGVPPSSLLLYQAEFLQDWHFFHGAPHLLG
jgi:hypothetical protein